MSFLRFLMVLSLVIWVGGIIFFATLAPTVFGVLPTRHLAGSVIGPLLTKLHWMGLASGTVYLVSSTVHARLMTGAARPFAARNLFIVAMLALTLTSQFGVAPKMAALRSSMGEIDSLALDSPARVQFNALHAWSTRLEFGVLFMGLAVVYLTAAKS